MARYRSAKAARRNDGSKAYVVEEILEDEHHGKVLVKWLGSPEEDATWENVHSAAVAKFQKP